MSDPTDYPVKFNDLEVARLRVTGALEVEPPVALPGVPVEVTGERDDPESALANLLSVLDGLGIITDSTTETD